LILMPARAASLGVADSDEASKRASSSAVILRVNASRRVRPANPRLQASGVRRWSALSARSVSRYSARDVNMRYGSLTPRVTRSSIITPT
jgi:hypothetical protein